MMEDVVAPVFQEYVPPPDAVSVVFCPEQIEMFPPMAVVMEFCTVTFTLSLADPQAVAAVRVYVMVVVGETTMDEVVWPLGFQT